MTRVEELSYEGTSRRVDVGGFALHFHEAGTGSPLVLLHGGGPGASGWSNFKQNLESLAEQFRVLIVDLPGYGRSDRPAMEGPLFEVNARAVRLLLDAIDTERAHFVGNSLGGGTALRFALDYPERVERLVLMGPAGGALPLFSPTPSDGLKLLFSFYAPPGPTRERMRQILDVMLFDTAKATDELLEERFQAAVEPEAIAAATRVFDAVQQGQAIADGAEQLWREVDRIQHRTLIIWGRDDRVLPLDGAFFMVKQMRDARLYVLPNCGHWAQLEHAEEFNRVVADFLLATD